MGKKPSIQKCYIPEDLLFKEILTKVPTKSIITFKSVSKTWLGRISGEDSTFIADHTRHHSTAAAATERCSILRGHRNGRWPREMDSLFFLGHAPGGSKLIKIDTSRIIEELKKSQRHVCLTETLTRLIGVTNGLVCFSLWFSAPAFSRVLVVCNPATGKFQFLPDPEPTSPSLQGIMTSGCGRCLFGFGEGSNNVMDYKVVLLEEFRCFTYADENLVSCINIQLFTKSRGRWRRLNGLTGFYILAGGGGGVTLDGTMHWAIAYDSQTILDDSFRILSFDLCNEEFREFDGPDCSVGYLSLIDWKGSLGAVLGHPGYVKEYQVWLRNSNNFIWTKMTNIDLYLYGLRIPLNFNSIWYDLIKHETGEFKKGKYRDLVCYEILFHMHSLVSP